MFLVGKRFHVETDHRPLVPLLSTKCLDDLPPRIQRFHMRLMRFNFSISHVPGKQLVTADTLSRAPAGQPRQMDDDFPISTYRDQYVCHLRGRVWKCDREPTEGSGSLPRRRQYV
ncbi:hypothetical protein M513_07037 [Trichuris suis]|uniref:Reverse transcriptase RNase H-like domain-containing protein n=1 Tax=Trichuris suis TaxID=68888 RepID=A0A085M4A9_9BILA|nr:hypothetical protein M513_07037 [Trichuris suis]